MLYRYGLILLIIQSVLTYFAFPNAQVPQANIVSAVLIFFALTPTFLVVLIYSGRQLPWFAGLSVVAGSLPAAIHMADMSFFPVIGVLILALLAVLVGSLGALVGIGMRFFYDRFPWAFILLAPAFFISIEFLRSVLVLYVWFMPPPAILFAYPLAGLPPLIQMSSLTGVFGPEFLVFFGAATMAVATWMWIVKTSIIRNFLKISPDVQPLDKAGIKKQWMVGSGVCLLLLVLIAVGNIEAVKISKMQNTAEFSLRPALLQLQIDPSAKSNWDRQFRHLILQKYTEMFQEAKQKNADVLVFTENALPIVLPKDVEAWQEIIRLTRAAGLPALIGLVTTLEEDMSFDTWYWVDQEGEIKDYYNKRFLVPFGEYMPMRFVVDPVIDAINYLFHQSYHYFKITSLPMDNYDLTAGKTEKIFSPTKDSKVSLKVCTEITIAGYFRESVRQGARLFLSPAAVNWFQTPVDWNLGLETCCFRAVETRRWVARLASMGGTAAIDALGVIRETTPFGRRAVLVPKMPLLDYKTFYVRFGDVFSWLCVSVCLVFLFFAWRRRQPGKS